MTVCILWAMVIIVLLLKAVRKSAWICLSVSWSTFAVASSIQIIYKINVTITVTHFNTFFTFALCSIALARHINCFCPTLNVIPPEPILASSPPYCRTVCVRLTRIKTDHSSASRCSLRGSKFSRTVPVNKNGSCGITERRDLEIKCETLMHIKI